jgi:methyl-accepting chemotaxis protein
MSKRGHSGDPQPAPLNAKAQKHTARRKSLAGMMSFIVLVLLVLSVAVTLYMKFVMDPRVQSFNQVRQQASQAESRLWRIGYLSNRLAWISEPQPRGELQGELIRDLEVFSQDLNNLASAIPMDLMEVKNELDLSYVLWIGFKSDLDRLARMDSPEEVKNVLATADVERRFRRILEGITSAANAMSIRTEQTSQNASAISTSGYMVFMSILLWVLILSRTVTSRIKTLHEVAQEVTRGEFEARAPVVGNDEITGLAEAFNTMTERIEVQLDAERKARHRVEEVLRALNQTADGLAGAASEILAATSQQAAAAAEEAAAVQETSVTVEELKQVAALSAQKAGTVATLAQQSEEVTLSGREAVDRSVEGMGRVRDQVQALAASMQRLSEQTQAVGEIISTVQDLAEQSNMLAVNAAIEAARAGEHGFGFSVVANEVRSLAEQSRQATVQVRSILGEIQKAVTAALGNTDAGARSVEAGMDLVNRAGEVIRSLTDTISHSSNAASQIRASSDQHAAGVEQIAQAIAAIHDASVQALESTRQTERAARVLNEMSTSLKSMLGSGDYDGEANEPI